MDSQLERKVDMIRNMVESYLNIVHKTQRDLCSEDNHAYDCQRGESVDDWVSACRNMEVVSVRGRAESGRPGAHISFFTCSLMKWCFDSNTLF